MLQPKSHAKKPEAHVAYRDIFGVRDARKGPLVLADCTSVEWPKGWTKADAATWRKANRLHKPSRA